MIIDAHIHSWDPRISPDILVFARQPELKCVLEPELLSETFASLSIEGSILIQSEPSVKHSNYCAHMAQKHNHIFASSGWLDPFADDLPAALSSLVSNGHGGFRLMLNRMSEQDLESSQLEVCCDMAGQHGLTIDLLGSQQHASIITRLLLAAPSTRFVLNHSALPDTSARPTSEWKMLIAQFSTYPNLWNKVSGLYEQSSDNEQNLYRHLDDVFSAFAQEKLMFASNWPLIEGVGGIPVWLKCLNQYLELQSFTEEAKQWLFRKSAESAYSLGHEKHNYRNADLS